MTDPRPDTHIDAEQWSAAATAARVVVVASGFAGFHTCRALERALPADKAHIAVISPTDYMLYSPLLPEVAAGVMDPRHIVIRRQGRLRPADSEPGKRHPRLHHPGPERARPRLQVMSRSALPARSHPAAAGAGRHRPAQRAGHPVHLRRGRRGLLRHRFHRPDAALRGCALAPYRNLVSDDSQWSLCDAAPVVLPELGADLGQPAVGLLRGRGIEVRLGPSLTHIRGDAVTFSDSSSTVPTRTVVWAAGASDSQLIGAVAQRHDLPLNKGRLVVDEYLAVPGHPGVWALGDAAAVLDLTHPGRITPPTARTPNIRPSGPPETSRPPSRLARPARTSTTISGSSSTSRVVTPSPSCRGSVDRPGRQGVTRGYHLLPLPSGQQSGQSHRRLDPRRGPVPLLCSTQLLRNNSGGPAGGRAPGPLPPLQRHRRHEVQDPAACQHRRPVQQDRVETRWGAVSRAFTPSQLGRQTWRRRSRRPGP